MDVGAKKRKPLTNRVKGVKTNFRRENSRVERKESLKKRRT